MTTINYTAVLRPLAQIGGTNTARCWYITFGLGKVAGGCFTRIKFADDFTDEDGAPYPEHVLDEVVRMVAVDLYGTAWAFHYRPDQADQSIHKYNLRLREHVDITALEVWS